MRLDNLTFPMGQSEVDGVLSVIDSIAGVSWAYRSQQPATPGSLPLMPAAVVGPPPPAGDCPPAWCRSCAAHCEECPLPTTC